jgi:hypothetical protein
MAQLTSDLALHRYVWGNISPGDLGSAGLQKLLRLGAKPRWISDKGSTLFHAVCSADTASLILQFSSIPKENQHVIGHTLLMVLSWFLNVDLVRKLLSAGASVNERDHFGWTVFEHLFRANSSSCISMLCYERCTMTKWVPTFEIAFNLLEAGADFGSSDSCTCHCSSKGCTALQFFLPSIHSLAGRRNNLHWIPWVLEAFLLLNGLQKRGLQTHTKSLVRRQRFDEIGLTHTCCVASEIPFLSQYTSPYTAAIEEEWSKDSRDLSTTPNPSKFGKSKKN